MVKKVATDYAIHSIKQKIEVLRVQLHELVKEKGLKDEAVVKLSQELDLHIVDWQRMSLSEPRQEKRKRVRVKKGGCAKCIQQKKRYFIRCSRILSRGK
ncbi:aspartyl-phosphate phosphatase Spo0E family protein [Brevibacillus antibioticus]|uniref:Aspartyl-phosphate phosphatase Spo0E family protein n=1 Tax=Brevibacillus antibioticus TaxID=2570228 RepID=A0A4U2YC86_9BACL|nr:aspartyl-phosphate phosphatase Spo0E family protein [Brevibacillus antibioticus]TKI57001.1 aspartyl-phosphate phosphatase Spo0E family protein [Brevibacillus antibioticus]